VDRVKDRYKSPQALEAAIRSKAGEVARRTGRSPGDLVTGFHFQRLLARIFLDDGGWMLKGGQSLLMRYPGRARLSRDADLFFTDTDTIDEALEALDRALARDLDDFFRFERSATETDGANAQVKINIWIGTSAKTALSVDLVVCRTPTGVPTAQPMRPEIPIDWPDTWPELQLYPLCDHIADKICAMYERHLRDGRDPVPSTRYRDLGDLLLISQSSEVIGAEVQAALRSEVPRRRALGRIELTLPPQFEVPDRASWTAGYLKAAKEITGLQGCGTLELATAAAEVFISPLLSPDDPGVWDPAQGSWKA
jgi:Nucleotidyl transferase AbiEii toxin, Type IV TA system